MTFMLNFLPPPPPRPQAESPFPWALLPQSWGFYSEKPREGKSVLWWTKKSCDSASKRSTASLAEESEPEFLEESQHCLVDISLLRSD